MQTICALERFKFASGAEEKIIRTFQAPMNFMENFKRLCCIDDDDVDGTSLDEIIKCMPIFSQFAFTFHLLIVGFFFPSCLSNTERCVRAIVGAIE